MPLMYVCRCGAELRLGFSDVRAADSRRVAGFGYGLDDVFGYLRRAEKPTHDLVDHDGEPLVAGLCQGEYERTGECHRCGECCRYVFQSISEEEANDQDHERWLALRGGRVDRTGYGAWDAFIHPCRELVEESPGVFVCGIYESRPEICRRWPEHPWDIEPYPKCGYKFTVKKSGK